MNWEAIGAIAETIGAIGVLGTLIYLSIQIRANTREIQESSNHAVLGQSIVNLNEDMGNGMPAIWAKDPAEYSDIEKSMVYAWTRRNFQNYEQVYHLYKRKRIDQEVFNSYRERMRRQMASEQTRQAWENDLKGVFTPSFVEYVTEEIIGGDA